MAGLRVKLADFDFALPPELIAQAPASPRDAARMLAIGPALRDLGVRDLPAQLKRGDLLVYNDTKVIKARLRGKRGSAGVEVTLHQRLESDTWRAFARPAKKLKAGDRIDITPDFFAEVEEKGDQGEVVLHFNRGGMDLLSALEVHGEMPLPPYIKRPRGGAVEDAADYQTLWGVKAGAVAASTAGLHFTPELLAALDHAGIGRVALTLHVGAGTFLPVKTEEVEEHKMHAEWGEISSAAAERIERTRAEGGRIVAIGTTALRLLETVAAADGRVREWSGETRLFVLPGYHFRVVDALLTNFHLPKSTLFMLVSAFAGLARMQAAYAHAIQHGYRFFSYGDCCLIERAAP
jgi:S-adenosylmethionine:tRNA ribosyltransferase-isomerase